MKYTLAIVATDPTQFREAVRSFATRVTPGPTSVYVFDNGRRAKVEKELRAGMTFGRLCEHVEVETSRRRINREDAYGKAWEYAANAETPIWSPVMFLPDSYRFIRAVNLLDVAHVLSREQLIQMAFVVQGDEPRRADVESRGSGIRWLRKADGFSLGPALSPVSLISAFPWHTGASELSFGIRASMPGTAFGLWGVGDGWVKETA